MKLPFKVDLSSKVVAITGAGGVICGEFSKALAACGAKVALLDINFEAAKKIADEIGENAIAVRCNCLDKNSIAEAKNIVEESFGKVNFLINGAGGNKAAAKAVGVLVAERAKAKNIVDVVFAADVCPKRVCNAPTCQPYIPILQNKKTAPHRSRPFPFTISHTACRFGLFIFICFAFFYLFIFFHL